MDYGCWRRSICYLCVSQINLLSYPFLAILTSKGIKTCNFILNYRDTICDLGGASELANYGEYSGAPSEQQTYEYAKTVLSLMVEERHPEGIVI